MHYFLFAINILLAFLFATPKEKSSFNSLIASFKDIDLQK